MDKLKVHYLIGAHPHCLAYAEASGLRDGDWWHVSSAGDVHEIPENALVTLVCTDKEYWSMEGYWHQDDFAEAIDQKDIWFRRVPLVEA